MDERAGVECYARIDCQITIDAQRTTGGFGSSAGEREIIVGARQNGLCPGRIVSDRVGSGGRDVKSSGALGQGAADSQGSAGPELEARAVDSHVEQAGCAGKRG